MFRPLLVVASTAFAQTDYSKFDQQRQIDDQQMKIDHLHSELQQQSSERKAMRLLRRNKTGQLTRLTNHSTSHRRVLLNWTRRHASQPE
jgi:hypothetical protein